VFNGVSQRCLKLSGEVEAFIRGDEVFGELTALIARKAPRRQPRVASRWLQRYLEGGTPGGDNRGGRSAGGVLTGSR
jgi:hypothetical protein